MPCLLRPFRPALGCIAALTFASFPATADDGAATIAGPVAVDVVKVRDGDTVEVDAHIWPQQTVRVAVRLRGVDAPELRAKCAGEKAAAIAARERLAALLAGGSVALRDISGDKYFGRVLAEVSASGEADIGATLLREGLAVRYDGAARRDWCGERYGLGSAEPGRRIGG